MKYYSHQLLVLGFTLSVAFNCFGQADTTLVNKIWANWILASIDYTEKNYTIMPSQFTSVLLSQHSGAGTNGNESFNSSVFKFLETNFSDNLKQGKCYFIQCYSPSACGFYDNAKYSIVLDTNRSIEIFSQSTWGYNWEIGISTDLDFNDFETKFEGFNDFYNLSEENDVLPFYYIITEFNNGNVSVKTLFTHL